MDKALLAFQMIFGTAEQEEWYFICSRTAVATEQNELNVFTSALFSPAHRSEAGNVTSSFAAEARPCFHRRNNFTDSPGKMSLVTPGLGSIPAF